MSDDTDDTLRERGSVYGNSTEFHTKAAIVWEQIFKTNGFTPVNVALAMVAWKLLRLSVAPDHADSYVDAHGYLKIAEGIVDPDALTWDNGKPDDPMGKLLSKEQRDQHYKDEKAFIKLPEGRGPADTDNIVLVPAVIQSTLVPQAKSARLWKQAMDGKSIEFSFDCEHCGYHLVRNMLILNLQVVRIETVCDYCMKETSEEFVEQANGTYA